MTTAAGLAGFLLERIAEDEEFLRAKWQKRGARLSVHYERGEDPDVNTPLGLSRQLAECDAKRRIVERVQAWSPDFPVTMGALLRLLAFPYAGHPDFREEWRA